MAKGRVIGEYRVDNIQSLMNHASKLRGTTLREWGVDEDDVVGGKGRFGQTLESAYFQIDNNARREADFEEIGVELKTTPLRKSGNTLVAKERMVLGIINFNTLLDEGWEGSFFDKNGKLLTVFYLHEPGKSFLDYIIKDTILWDFPGDDLWIIKNDWNKIAGMVRDGRAHEISERHTVYLKACVKGAGHGKDYRTQPFSDEPAHQRAFSLGNRYVTTMWDRRKEARERFDRAFDPGGFDYERSFEENVLQRFMPFVGMKTRDIEDRILETPYSKNKKDRYAALARKMLGVDTAKVEEFEIAEIKMKTVRLSKKGKMKEHMSFRHFKYEEFLGKWIDSVPFDEFDKKFLFVIYKEDGQGDLRLHNVFFWEMPQADFDAIESVWNRTRDLVLGGEYDNLPRIVEHHITHVRPHARDRNDTTPGLDGIGRIKKSFWLNSGYIESIIMKNERANR